MNNHEAAEARGEEAARILNSPLFEQAFADTRKALLEAWAGLPTSDSENAKDLHRMVKTLDKVKKCIQVHIDTGYLAHKQIEALTRKEGFFKR